jgi:hypothetical protein
MSVNDAIGREALSQPLGFKPPMLCAYCHQDGSATQCCGICLLVHYCGDKCQEQDRNRHEASCVGVLRHLGNVPLNRLEVGNAEMKLVQRHFIATYGPQIIAKYKEQSLEERGLVVTNILAVLDANTIENSPFVCFVPLTQMMHRMAALPIVVREFVQSYVQGKEIVLHLLSPMGEGENISVATFRLSLVPLQEPENISNESHPESSR